jgi:hypothetical protein
MKKIICSITLIMFVFLVGMPMQVFAQQTSIKLFDATPVFGTGPVTSPAEAIPFASKSLIIHFAEGDTAVVSSTPDGTGPIVIDNFLTINGQNACVGVEGQAFPDSCFGASIRDLGDPGVVGMPIGTVLTPITPIDVSASIPSGTSSTVVFDLRDYGSIAGNTDLFLVTTATVTPTQPSTASNAFDAAMDLVTGQLSPALVTEFQLAFEEQVSAPVLKELEKAHADPKKIDVVKQQLKQANLELASEAATAFTSLLDGQTLLSQLQRNLGKAFSEPSMAPTFIEKFVPDFGAPKIKIKQSIKDILAHGFDSDQVEFNWKDISAEIVVGQDVTPSPVFATITPKGGVTGEMGPDGKPKVKAKVGVKAEGQLGTATLSATGEMGGNGTSFGGGVEFEARPSQVSDLSRTGIVALLAVVIALGAFRRKPAGSGAA